MLHPSNPTFTDDDVDAARSGRGRYAVNTLATATLHIYCSSSHTCCLSRLTPLASHTPPLQPTPRAEFQQSVFASLLHPLSPSPSFSFSPFLPLFSLSFPPPLFLLLSSFSPLLLSFSPFVLSCSISFALSFSLFLLLSSLAPFPSLSPSPSSPLFSSLASISSLSPSPSFSFSPLLSCSISFALSFSLFSLFSPLLLHLPSPSLSPSPSFSFSPLFLLRSLLHPLSPSLFSSLAPFPSLSPSPSFSPQRRRDRQILPPRHRFSDEEENPKTFFFSSLPSLLLLFIPFFSLCLSVPSANSSIFLFLIYFYSLSPLLLYSFLPPISSSLSSPLFFSPFSIPFPHSLFSLLSVFFSHSHTFLPSPFFSLLFSPSIFLHTFSQRPPGA
ncbi:hypothetical protein C7M84_019502 [Penaeus vannamei]|uniref:Uncharacterized protein n=1 Tax=Penaeus vannamei TaxID=6689 RepID=A0A3R7QBL6_PENVA|nr:hypothetical protein C7M84_019502 [Penaeus vannamei]